MGKTNINSICSKLRTDLKKRQDKVNLNKVGQYIVNKIKEEATDTLIGMKRFDPDGLETSPEYDKLIESISYKIITNPNGSRSLQVGIFDNLPGAELMEEIEYGSLKNPEVPVFRTIIPALEDKVKQYIKNGMKLL